MVKRTSLPRRSEFASSPLIRWLQLRGHVALFWPLGPPHTHTIEKGRDSLLQAVIIRVMFLSTKLPKWNKVWVSLRISFLKGKVLLLPNPVLEGLIFNLPCDKMGSVGRRFHLTLCFCVWGSLEVDTVWPFQSELLSSHGTAFLFENDWERNWLFKLCSLTFSLKVIRTLSHQEKHLVVYISFYLYR